MSAQARAKAAAALAAVALAACSGAQDPATEEPQPDDAGPAASPLDRDPGLALAACRVAFERVGLAPAADRYAIVAEGCADLFSMPVCGEAIRLSPQAAPELRPAMVAVACQHAYCPIFEAAGSPPQLCGLRPASMPPQELAEPWGAFVRTVLALELDLDEDAPELMSLAIGLAPTPSVSGEAVDGEEAGPSPTLTVAVGREGSGYVVSADVDGEGFGPFPLTLEPNQEDFAGLLEAAARRAAGGRAVLQLDASMSYGVAVHLMDALRSLGIERIALAVDAAHDGSPP